MLILVLQPFFFSNVSHSHVRKPWTLRQLRKVVPFRNLHFFHFHKICNQVNSLQSKDSSHASCHSNNATSSANTQSLGETLLRSNKLISFSTLSTSIKKLPPGSGDSFFFQLNKCLFWFYNLPISLIISNIYSIECVGFKFIRSLYIDHIIYSRLNILPHF